MRELSRFYNETTRPWLSLFCVFAAAWSVCVFLSTKEPPVPPNDGVIDLPVGDKESVFFGPYAEYLVEGERPLSLQDVQSRGDWAPVGDRYMSFGPLTKPVWIRAKIVNTTDEAIAVRFDTRRVAFKRVELFVTDDDGSNPQQFLDYRYEAPFSERPVYHRLLAADTELAPRAAKTAYVRFFGIYNTVLPLRLASPEAFEWADKGEMFWSALFYGTFCTIFVLTLLITPLIGWRLSASFVFFLITSILSVWAVEGYVDQYFVPDKTPMTARLTDSFYLLNYLSVLFLSRNIFELRSKARRLDAVILAAIAAVFIFTVVYFFVGINNRGVYVAFAYSARVLSLALSAAVGLWAVFNGQKGGVAFSFSAVLLTMASIYMVIDETFGFPFGGIPFTLRWLITIEASAFAIAIAQNVMGLKGERDAAVAADLAATREKLRLSLALRESQVAYGQARRQAGQYLERLQSVSHDILQPLSSLRVALQSAPIENEARSKKMIEAFDYLEALARDNTEEVHSHNRFSDRKGEESASDALPVSVIARNVVAMFEDEAQARGVDLRFDASAADCAVDEPVLLMRAVSNLVANAIRHAEANHVTLSCALAGDMIAVTVQDDGKGMTGDEIARYLEQGKKGAASEGSGLGLSIVADAARNMKAEFSLTSAPGEGTTARVCVPR